MQPDFFMQAASSCMDSKISFLRLEECMPICPECESALDFDEDDVEEGDVVVCDECGSEYEIVATDPLELSKVEEDYEDEEEFKEEEEE
jgi:alpha-aminoadipate carrier protein LysW